MRVDPEKKFISGTNTIRFKMLQDDSAHPARALSSALQIDKIVLGKTELKYDARLAARSSWTFRRRCARGIPIRSTFTTREIRSSEGRFGGITFEKDPAGHPWINTACEEEGASVWWPNKDQWRDEVEGHADHALPCRTG